MLKVLGAAAAYPENVIDNSLLAELDSGLSPDSSGVVGAVEQRRTSLPLDYLQRTGNADLAAAKQVALDSPTSLGVKAARAAAERAGVALSEVGLIVAETATPLEVTPSEAQRLGCALGLKVPAYDIVGGAAAFPLFADVLSKWEADCVPEIVLCVSTNTPTQLIDYRSGAARFYFGDAAAAWIVSRKRSGRYEAAGTLYRSAVLERSAVEVRLNDPISVDQKLLRQQLPARCGVVLRALGLTGAAGQLVCCSLLDEELAEDLRSDGLLAGTPWSCSPTHGDALGSFAGAALAENWDSGSDMLLIGAGAGPCCGGVQLTRRES